MGDGRFKPGHSANPNGRPVGSRNKRDIELLDRLEKRGDRPAVDILSKIANDPNEPKPLRIQAAIGVAPYQTCKLGLVPQPVPLVYVAQPVELPHPHATGIEHTLANIEHISDLRRTGKLDQDTADRLVAEQRILRDGLIEQAKLVAAQGGPPHQEIRISGGLPPLPGTDIDMDGSQFDARVARANGFIPPVPVIPHPESPLAEKPGPPEPPPHLRKPEGDDPA
jgi:hypothetical protein